MACTSAITGSNTTVPAITSVAITEVAAVMLWVCPSIHHLVCQPNILENIVVFLIPPTSLEGKKERREEIKAVPRPGESQDFGGGDYDKLWIEDAWVSCSWPIVQCICFCWWQSYRHRAKLREEQFRTVILL